MKTKYVIFDLDDTLISELDYLKSAYQEIASILDPQKKEKLYAEMLTKYQKGVNVFEQLTVKYPETTLNQLLDIYRNHDPIIKLNDGAAEVIDWCKNQNYKLGLISDGRSITQRNKLKAVGIEQLFDRIIISEEFGSAKPDQRNFQIFHSEKIYQYYYIADNVQKDFITPNSLGWTTVCLLSFGTNIHSQDHKVSPEYQPQLQIKNLRELIGIL